jgi:hypothetical protein
MSVIIYERSIFLRDGQPFYVGPWRETSAKAAASLTANALSEQRQNLLVQIAYVSSPTKSVLFDGR